MRKLRAGNEEITLAESRNRVLARVLAEDLRVVRGEGEILPEYTITDPPPGRDVTFQGSDGGETF